MSILGQWITVQSQAYLSFTSMCLATVNGKLADRFLLLLNEGERFSNSKKKNVRKLCLTVFHAQDKSTKKRQRTNKAKSQLL